MTLPGEGLLAGAERETLLDPAACQAMLDTLSAAKGVNDVLFVCVEYLLCAASSLPYEPITDETYLAELGIGSRYTAHIEDILDSIDIEQLEDFLDVITPQLLAHANESTRQQIQDYLEHVFFPQSCIHTSFVTGVGQVALAPPHAAMLF